MSNRHKRDIYVLYILIFIGLLLFINCAIYKFKHPELTDTQRTIDLFTGKVFGL